MKEWFDALVEGRPYGQALLHAVFIIVFVLVSVLILIYMERKVSGSIQSRLGPMRVGPYGLLQTVADALKLLGKEDIIPAASDRFMFQLAPYFVFVPSVLVFIVLPFSAGWLAHDFSLAVLFIIGASTIAIMGIMMAGWGTNNKYSLLGGLRSAAQLISYEIPIVMAVLCVVFYAASMSTADVVDAQSGLWRLFGIIPLPRWFIFSPPLMLAALLYYVAQLAETNRTPFDLPEAESELVSGFHTEYSGMRFAFFMLAEFASTFFAAALGVVLFFGGWDGLTGFWGALWFLTKSYIGVFGLMWVRWTLPRVRIDQLLGFAWKVLVPAGLAAVLWTMAVVVYEAGG